MILPPLFKAVLCTFAGMCSVGLMAEAITPALTGFAATRNEGLPALALDFTTATVVAPGELTGPERKAVQLLVAEVERRTLVTWPVTPTVTHSFSPQVIVGRFAQVRALLGTRANEIVWRESEVTAEGYQIATLSAGKGNAAVLVIAGCDARGVLFGVGHLLRKLQLGPARAGLSEPLAVATSPKYSLRGHQLGYRPKPNSYSGWDVPDWERYVRELAIFGCNAIELLPPRTDDLPDSPHYPRPPLEMMRAMSQIAADYGIDVWIWYPALDENYGDPAQVQTALAEWGEVFRTLPRIDAVLVPAGDPGHTPPQLLMPFLEKQTANLRTYHPQATMWIAPQGFKQPDLDFFFNYLAQQQPAWLKGVVFAPWIHMTMEEFRRRVPANYPLRYYPDITHTKECQYPVQDWDPAFALTMGREPICPRPMAMVAILRLLQPHTVGAVTYSEGMTDDVNKVVWSALSWNPETDVQEVLRDYARFYISERFTDKFADGLFALENNWRGPLATSETVPAALKLFQDLESRATPADLRNWRFQSALFRAYSDAVVQVRLRRERAAEDEAMKMLGVANTSAVAAMDRAGTILENTAPDVIEAALRTRVYQLAEGLFQSVHYKSSVPLYRATMQRRGAVLDTLDYPLNNRVWLQAEFERIRKLGTEGERQAELARIAHWTDAGPGGFYDDLGNSSAQPRLVMTGDYAKDPAFIHTPLNGHFPADGAPIPLRTSWVDYIWGLNDLPISVRYPEIDPTAEYEVRVVYPKYPKSSQQAKLRLRANETIEIHSYLEQPEPVRPLTFPIPREATKEGRLTLTWNREPGLGGSGKGCDISEVWLIKKSR